MHLRTDVLIHCELSLTFGSCTLVVNKLELSGPMFKLHIAIHVVTVSGGGWSQDSDAPFAPDLKKCYMSLAEMVILVSKCQCISLLHLYYIVLNEKHEMLINRWAALF